MEIARTVAELKEIRHKLPEPVGFVPTMGYLHVGHLSLVRQARAENKSVIASIFVNPTQFAPSEDFEAYPRNTERDIALLTQENTDLLFLPEPSAVYPEGFNTWINVEGITSQLEGASRPGHFKGVTTVVAKLFNMVEPTKAYFGQKDAQQALVIQKMVADLNMNLEVIVSPTIRESDGLAMSSRNVYLGPEERRAALVLWEALQLAHRLKLKGEKSAEGIRLEMISLIDKVPLARIDYVSIADTASLQELTELDYPALVSMSVRIGKTRLIDNIIME